MVYYKLKFFFAIITAYIFQSCNVTSVYSPKSENVIEKRQNYPIEIERFRYFDLFTMQGIEPCDNDSCIIVTEKGDSIKIETNYPKKYSLTLCNKGNYWYSHAEFDMNKDRYRLGKSESWPRRYDRFILTDTILDYEQVFYNDEIFKTLYIKTKETYKALDLTGGYKVDNDPQEILSKILKILHSSNQKTFRSVLNIKRKNSEMEYIGEKYGNVYSGSFPELQVWGGAYGLGL
ncbi:MAG: hypothetical protein K2I64_03305 [Muribaculaceae bacterium]|nr:hypothetical protein [Muribaculaceae bacterium]